MSHGSARIDKEEYEREQHEEYYRAMEQQQIDDEENERWEQEQYDRAMELQYDDEQESDALDVDDAEPRPVHDRVPHVDRNHIGSSPDGARPVHEWIHRSTSGTRSPRLRHEFFHTLNIDVHRS